MKAIYLDHAASTPIHPQVIETMVTAMHTTFGNPSSLHMFGRAARKIVNQARNQVAETIGATAQEILFTSGGTEGANTAILSAIRSQSDKGNHIITSQVEHSAVINLCKQLEKQGYQVTYLPVNEQGFVSVEDVSHALTEQTILVSLQMVNNETGAIQPIQEIGELLREHQAIFHTDAVQAFCKLPISVDTLQVDMLSTSAHKINGPKGVGFLYLRKHILFVPIFYGGEQERKRRAGTENVIAIAGFGKAIEIYQANQSDYEQQNKNLRAIFLEKLQAIEHWQNTSNENVVPHIINISFPDICIETLLTNLDMAGIAVSSGSACTAGSVEPSHVLSAMIQDNPDRAGNAIRISFGLGNTPEDVAWSAEKLVEIVKKI